MVIVQTPLVLEQFVKVFVLGHALLVRLVNRNRMELMNVFILVLPVYVEGIVMVLVPLLVNTV
jgi:hypothetical protein